LAGYPRRIQDGIAGRLRVAFSVVRYIRIYEPPSRLESASSKVSGPCISIDRLTFDMSCVTRLAGARQLDGRVRRHAGREHLFLHFFQQFGLRFSVSLALTQPIFSEDNAMKQRLFPLSIKDG